MEVVEGSIDFGGLLRAVEVVSEWLRSALILGEEDEKDESEGEVENRAVARAVIPDVGDVALEVVGYDEDEGRFSVAFEEADAGLDVILGLVALIGAGLTLLPAFEAMDNHALVLVAIGPGISGVLYSRVKKAEAAETVDRRPSDEALPMSKNAGL